MGGFTFTVLGDSRVPMYSAVLLIKNAVILMAGYY